MPGGGGVRACWSMGDEVSLHLARADTALAHEGGKKRS